MLNVLKRDLKDGKRTCGVWMTIPSMDVAESLSRLPFDWFVFDQEHSPLDDQLTQQLMQAIGGTGITPLVRVAWNDPVLIKKALDIGAYGVVIPYVNTRDDAERAVRACMYPPRGIRGCGPRRMSVLDANYLATANDELLIVVQIETTEAIENMDEILSVQGIDAYFVGPVDLSASMGLIGDLSNPLVQQAIARIREAGTKHGLPGGLWRGGGASLAQRVSEEWEFIALGTDLDILMEGGRGALREIGRLRNMP
jgi:2-keto-3-deoxy-L-rhamnonate aldolase RhmA